MSKEDIKKAITDICDNRLKTLGEYDFYKNASLGIKFWRVTGLVDSDIEGIIDRCEESRLNTLLSEFTFYVPSGSAFESSDAPGPGPGPGPGPDPHDYSKDYFTIVALENTTILINVDDGGISYSLDGGTIWSEGSGSFTVDVQNGEKLLLKGDVIFNQNTSGSETQFIQSAGNYSIEGNIMSLSYEDDFVDKKTIQTLSEYEKFFANDTKLISTENLVLPATTLTQGCYQEMFSGCTSLTTAPKILPATTVTINCYYNMFGGCTSLTTAPELPATELAEQCYMSMFSGCTSLTTAPELPATELVEQCYENMFDGCTNLNYIKALFLTTPGTGTIDWVSNVSVTGTFVRNENTTWNVRGANGIPEGWTVEPPFSDAN